MIERAAILEDTDFLTTANFPYDIQHVLENATSSLDLNTVEKHHIQKVLAFAKGNKTEAARLLNIGLTTLYRKIEEYKL